MALPQSIEDQQAQCEKILKECAILRKPPLTIAEILWTAPSKRDEYDIEIQLTGQEPPSPHHFLLPGFDLAQNGPYLRDITKGWLYEIEKKSSPRLEA
jgi:hypothetical protein